MRCATAAEAETNAQRHACTLFQIRPVRSAADLEATLQLFNAYASALEVDLSYQDFATELATLPGKYAPPPVKSFSRATVTERRWDVSAFGR